MFRVPTADMTRGILTLGVGIASFWLMPPSPSQTKSKHVPNGYLTDREVKIIVNRTIRDDPGKVSHHYPLSSQMTDRQREECITEKLSAQGFSGTLSSHIISGHYTSFHSHSIFPPFPYRIISKSPSGDSVSRDR